MTVRVHMKRLATVEIDPHRSHQHEFNADRLRRELGFSEDASRGTVDFLFYTADGSDPVTVQETYTLYDARRNDPRRTEWRMYYTNENVAKYARVDDLMLLFRPDSRSGDLLAVIARKGTIVERSLARQLAGREAGDIVDQLFVDSAGIDAQTAKRLLLRSVPDSARQTEVTDDAVKSHPLFARALAQWDMPTTTEMARAAQEIVAKLGVAVGQPDDFVHMALDAETRLFRAIEQDFGRRELAAINNRGHLDFHILMEICTSFSQRRRSRRGRSLENQFRHLLQGLRIPHGYQCVTERGRTPDFIFPSCAAYRDPAVPDDRLRMVGCKTIVRERHTQWLVEADRIRLKYALCVDPGLSDGVVRRYRNRLRFFLPRAVLDRAYSDRAIMDLLGSVSDLIDDLRSATA